MSIFIDILIGKRELSPPTLPDHTSPLSEWSDTIWTNVLERFVSDSGLVDYVGLREDIDFIRLVEVVSRQSPQSHPDLFATQRAALSFWINAYNLLTIWAVLSDDISSSVQDSSVSGWIRINAEQDFFVGNRVKVGGNWMNLYDLENKVIRGYGDGRIHAAINCASNSCPMLENRAFQGVDLEERLDLAMRRMINSSRHLQVDTVQQIVYASPIFDWYKSDFNARRRRHLFGYWIEFAEEPILSLLRRAKDEQFNIRWMNYDWGLNQREG